MNIEISALVPEISILVGELLSPPKKVIEFHKIAEEIRNAFLVHSA